MVLLEFPESKMSKMSKSQGNSGSTAESAPQPPNAMGEHGLGHSHLKPTIWLSTATNIFTLAFTGIIIM